MTYPDNLGRISIWANHVESAGSRDERNKRVNDDVPKEMRRQVIQQVRMVDKIFGRDNGKKK